MEKNNTTYWGDGKEQEWAIVHQETHGEEGFVSVCNATKDGREYLGWHIPPDAVFTGTKDAMLRFIINTFAFASHIRIEAADPSDVDDGEDYVVETRHGLIGKCNKKEANSTPR